MDMWHKVEYERWHLLGAIDTTVCFDKQSLGVSAGMYILSWWHTEREEGNVLCNILPSLKFSNRFMFLIFLAGLMFLYLAELEVFVIISSSTGLAGDPHLG